MTTLSPGRPALGTPAAWHFPRPRQSTLANGITVHAFDLPGQLVVSAELLLDVPLALEDPDQEGVATLALRACDDGTRSHRGILLAEALEAQGASLGGHAGLAGTSLGVQAPADRLGGALALLTEVVAEPAYTAKDVARHVALRRSEIDRILAHPGGCTAWALRTAVADPSCRGSRPDGGTRETVGRLTAPDVRTFHDRWWTPAGAHLVIAGALPDGLDRLLADTVGAWAPGELAMLRPLASPTVPTTRPAAVWLLDRPDAVQADIRFGRLTPTREHPAWAAVQVAANAVGGMFGSRLNRVLREESGFTYGASCTLTPGPDVALFSAQASCRVEVAAPACRLARDLLDLRTQPLDETEVAAAVMYLTGRAPLGYDTAEAVVTQAGALVQAGLPITWLDQHHDRLRAVTAAAANDAFAQWIDPTALPLVIAGPADALLGPLRDTGLDPVVVDVTGRPVA